MFVRPIDLAWKIKSENVNDAQLTTCCNPVSVLGLSVACSNIAFTTSSATIERTWIGTLPIDNPWKITIEISKNVKNCFSPQFQLCRPLVALKHNCSVLRRPIVYRLARGYNTKYLRILCAESGDSLDSAGSGVDSRCAWRAKVKVAAFSDASQCQQ